MRFKSILFPVVAIFSLNTNAAPLYTSQFTDNGNKVTEVRTFAESRIETWEWLDLTVTNGIIYSSLVDDLADDNKLNNSSLLNANNINALADIAELSINDQSGWETQSLQNIRDLFENFFNLNLETDYYFRRNVASVDEFIRLFGDSYHEGLLDDDPTLEVLFNSIGFSNSVGTIGFTNTIDDRVQQPTLRVPYVYDGKYGNDEIDRTGDHILLYSSFGQPEDSHFILGTWLSREIVSVNVPATISLFALALMGLVLRRRLM